MKGVYNVLKPVIETLLKILEKFWKKFVLNLLLQQVVTISLSKPMVVMPITNDARERAFSGMKT